MSARKGSFDPKASFRSGSFGRVARRKEKRQGSHKTESTRWFPLRLDIVDMLATHIEMKGTSLFEISKISTHVTNLF